MFSTCLFCHASLGANESIEHFPVGRRLAYDAERGRLWVVCRKCARWNLTPLEERWEALEECERAYRGTRARVSTDNIALARLRDGTELVRIGRPLLPELATWRYGDQLRSRRRGYVKAMVGATTVGIAGVAFTVFGIASTATAAGLFSVVAPLAYSVLSRKVDGVVVSLPATDGLRYVVAPRHAGSLQISLTDAKALALSMDCCPHVRGGLIVEDTRTLTLTGEEAVGVLSKVIVHVNMAGASKVQVADAVRELDERPSPFALLEYASSRVNDGPIGIKGLVRELPAGLRLAMEMSLHREDERRAMSGELGALYARWEEAERIAKIADGELTNERIN